MIDKEGTLVVTSRRVALVHQGVTSFPIGKILDVEVDHDRQMLILTRDNVATPSYLTTRTRSAPAPSSPPSPRSVDARSAPGPSSPP